MARSSLLSPFALARRNAIYKGLLGGERGWLVIGGVVWGVRLLRKALGKNEQFVTLEKLKPGEWMSIRALATPTRKQKRQARAS
jgi:hypothetical protein